MSTPMRKGDAVAVYPAGYPFLKVLGRIASVSDSQRTAAIRFPDGALLKPYAAVHVGPPGTRVMLFLVRSRASGPWKDLITDAPYEVVPEWTRHCAKAEAAL